MSILIHFLIQFIHMIEHLSSHYSSLQCHIIILKCRFGETFLYYQCYKWLCWFFFVETIKHFTLINRKFKGKHLFGIQIFWNIITSVTFDQFNCIFTEYWITHFHMLHLLTDMHLQDEITESLFHFYLISQPNMVFLMMVMI